MSRQTIYTLFLIVLLPAVAFADENSATSNARAVFAGGCFWCMEPPFEKLAGVKEVASGYTGGGLKNPTYKQVSSGKTKHIESIRVEFDPSKVPYSRLLEVFWRNVDPLNSRGQFCDNGYQYTTAIFYADEEQKKLAEQSKANIEKQLGQKVATQLLPATEFYDAEQYHQDYYKKNPIRYKFYRYNCGRDKRLEQLWGAK